MNSDAPLSPTAFLAAERTFLAWVRTCLAVLGFGLAFSQLFPVSIYGRNMSNAIAYCTMAAAIFLLTDSTARYFIRLHDLENGKFDDDKIGPAILFVSVLGIILVPAGIGGQRMTDYKNKKREMGQTSQPNYALLSRGAGMLSSGGGQAGSQPVTDREGELLRRLDELITLMKRREEAAGNIVG